MALISACSLIGLITLIIRENNLMAIEGASQDSQNTTGGEQTTIAPESSTDHLLTYIVPAIIIIGMLILAIVLACMLRRKQQSGKLNLFYSESLPPRLPVILNEELNNGDQDYLGIEGNAMYKHPVLFPSDHINNRHQGKSTNSLNNIPELDKLLQLEQAPINIDPVSLKCMSRPSPIYQKRQK